MTSADARTVRPAAVRNGRRRDGKPGFSDRLRGAGIGIPALTLVVALAGSAYLALEPATDPDYGWHVANGRNLWDGILLGGHDVYSWTAAGRPWVAHEWLTDVAMAFLNDTLGPAAVSIAAAAVVVLALGLTALRLRGHGLVTVALTLAVICRAAYVSFGVRPQMLELLYLAIWLLALHAWLSGQLPSRPLFLLAVGLMLLWANTHGSFLLAPVAAAALAGALAVAGDRRVVTAGSLTLLAAVLPLVNPWGPALYGFAAQSLSSGVTGRLIQEWRPPNLLSPDFAPFTEELILLLGGVLLAAARLASSHNQRSAASPSRSSRDDTGTADGVRRLLANVRYTWAIVLTVLMIVLALRSGRFVMLVGVCAAPLLAWTVEQVLDWAGALSARAHGMLPGRAARVSPDRGRLNLVLGTAVAGILCAAGLARVSPAAQDRAMAARYPVALLPALDRAVAAAGGPAQARLLNAYDYGGFLLQHRPRLPVFIDGRSEVYGDAFLAQAASLFDVAPGWQSTLERLHPQVALLGADSRLAGALEGIGWRTRASDQLAVLLVAPGHVPR